MIFRDCVVDQLPEANVRLVIALSGAPQDSRSMPALCLDE